MKQKIKDLGGDNDLIQNNSSGSTGFSNNNKNSIQQVNVVNVKNNTRVYNQVNYMNPQDKLIGNDDINLVDSNTP